MTFVLSKLLWVVFAPGNLLLIVLACGTVALLAGWRRLGTTLVGFGSAGFVAIALLPLGSWLLIPLENRFPPLETLPERVDGIVVLGGSMDARISVSRGQAALNEAAERLTSAVELARTFPEARLIYSGGVGQLVGGTGAMPAVERFWRSQGVPAERMVFESEARNTYENAVFSERLADPQPGERWLLVTSAAHMPRSVGIFRAIGWPVIPYPVDYRTTGRPDLEELLDGWVQLDFSDRLADLDHATKSWVGLIAYRLMGRTNELLPAP